LSSPGLPAVLRPTAFCGAKSMQINTEAFSALNLAIFEKLNPEPWRGKSPIKWCKDVTQTPCSRVALLGAGLEPMDRRRLFKFCAQSDVEAEDIFLAVCAWGGMRTGVGLGPAPINGALLLIA
jgi:hypothetical protein